MTFLADESVDRQIVEALRADGHEVAYVAEMEPGISDDEVLERANASTAILLTQDKDFGELVYRLNRISRGAVLFRLAGLTPAAKASCAFEVVSTHGPQLDGAFTVVSPGNVRIRQS